MARKSLRYIASQAIVDYITQYPIDWMDKDKALAKRGGVADKAGPPPTLAIEEFLTFLEEHNGLFTQQQYYEWCSFVWKEWLCTKTELQQKGMQVKVYRNYYPAFIDSLHVRSLLIEAGYFQECLIDSQLDGIGKTDVLVIDKKNVLFRIALFCFSKQSQDDRGYKKQNRNKGANATIEIVLPRQRPKHPGNKRWYHLEDFNQILEHVNNGGDVNGKAEKAVTIIGNWADKDKNQFANQLVEQNPLLVAQIQKIRRRKFHPMKKKILVESRYIQASLFPQDEVRN